MRAITIACVALAASASAPPANTMFRGNMDGPKCWLHNGHTTIHYDHSIHKSFHCISNANSGPTGCKCLWNHPTHAHGKCMALTHSDGTSHTIGGDCSETGHNPRHGGWSAFTGWSTCSKVCGGGSQTRTRTCTNPAPKWNGRKCAGSGTETRACNSQPCPINGGWSGWTGFDGCSAICGGGQQTRTRKCNNPAPKHGGKNCVGNDSESRKCNTQPCPIHGQWGSFGSFNACSKVCGGGTQTRTRECNKPRPQHGGNHCPGSASHTVQCNTHNCPIHGGYSQWGGYGSCSKKCGGGTKTRYRSCTNPRPQHGGRACSGPNSSSTSCNTQSCHKPFTTRFSATCQDQYFKVPEGTTSLSAQLFGASGGGSNAEGWRWPGGNGGKATGTFAVTPGEVLTIKVGCRGLINSPNSAYPKGGLGANRGGYQMGNGGGRSAIMRGNTDIIVAGGGGGAGGTGWANHRGGVGRNPTTGGCGGGASGTAGKPAWPGHSRVGGGGTSSRAGTPSPGYNNGGGWRFDSRATAPWTSAKHQGGCTIENCGGGGGDGYYGGGGGGVHGGGGGGSGHCAGGVSSCSLQACAGAHGVQGNHGVNGWIILSGQNTGGSTGIFQPTTRNFGCNGGVQFVRVPAGSTTVHFDLKGASGGGSNAEGWQWPGGAGGRNTGSFKVTPGEELKIVVGCAGAIHSGSKAFPNGGLGANRGGYQMGNGGGRTSVARGGGRGAAGGELAVAGGGGGAGGTGWANHRGGVGRNPTTGGCGGGSNAGAGQPAWPGHSKVGGGATSTRAGTPSPGWNNGGGWRFDTRRTAPWNSGHRQGGCTIENCGGGGGDGWYGGGGGGVHGGGGGGSGYCASGVSCSQTNCGGAAGRKGATGINGSVKLTFV